MDKDDKSIEDMLDDNKSNKPKTFRTGCPGKPSNSTVFADTPQKQPGDFGRTVGNTEVKKKLLQTEEEILLARLKKLREQKGEFNNE